MYNDLTTNYSTPRRCILDYVIDTTTDKINSTGGIALVGKIIEGIGFGHNSKLKHPAVLKSIIGLFSQGRTAFEEIDLVRNDSFLRYNQKLWIS